jgi:hypothetical protein
LFLVHQWLLPASAGADQPASEPALQHAHGANAQKAHSERKDMRGSMMMGMNEMQKMPMSGRHRQGLHMMMKIHHQQALNMAEMG